MLFGMQPLVYRTYNATETELQSELKLVYATMQSTDEVELSGLLWSKAILIRCMLKHQRESTGRGSNSTRLLLPSKIASWLFMTSRLLFLMLDWHNGIEV